VATEICGALPMKTAFKLLNSKLKIEFEVLKSVKSVARRYTRETEVSTEDLYGFFLKSKKRNYLGKIVVAAEGLSIGTLIHESFHAVIQLQRAQHIEKLEEYQEEAGAFTLEKLITDEIGFLRGNGVKFKVEGSQEP